MTTELGEIRAQIKRMQTEIGALYAAVRRIERADRDGVPEFAKLEGAWSGANFSEEEIDAAKIKVRDVE